MTNPIVGWFVFLGGTFASFMMTRGMMNADQEKNSANSAIYQKLWYCRRCGTQADEGAFWTGGG